MSDFEEDVSAFDAAGYIHQMAEEMAGLARRTGLVRVAACLELARSLAEDAAVGARREAQTGLAKAAPEDAA